jgi:hypothetical protein
MRIRNWFDLCINVFQNGGAEAEAQTGQNTKNIDVNLRVPAALSRLRKSVKRLQYRILA